MQPRPITIPSLWPVLSALLIGFLAGATFVAVVNQPARHVCDHPPIAQPVDLVVPAADTAVDVVRSRIASIDLDRTRVAPGQRLTVGVSSAVDLPRDAWVGVIPSIVPHGDEAENDQWDLTYQYMDGRRYATMVFTAPAEPGSYDIRLHDTDANGSELASVTFQVIGF